MFSLAGDWVWDSWVAASSFGGPSRAAVSAVCSMPVRWVAPALAARVRCVWEAVSDCSVR